MIFSVTGTRLFIGEKITHDPKGILQPSDFADTNWIRIKDIESLGSLGDMSREVEFRDVSEGRTIRVKGDRSGSVMEITCGLNVQCSGQLHLLQAEKTNWNYKFCMIFNDMPTAHGTPSQRYFIARVGNIEEAFESGDDVMKFTASLWVNSSILRIDATEDGNFYNLPQFEDLEEVENSD